jgi:hypothetical protein
MPIKKNQDVAEKGGKKDQAMNQRKTNPTRSPVLLERTRRNKLRNLGE